MHAVHVSPYVGTWYPDCRTDLERLLDDLFETSAQRTGAFLFANPLGFVVPHAGLQYSGAVAAAAYRHVRRRQPRRAVVLGFAHRGGVSIDPSVGLLFVNMMNVGQWGHLEKRGSDYVRTSAYGPYARFWDRETRIPCQNPPFGELIAVDLADRKS